MKTAGGVLKEARLSHGITIEAVEQATKIRHKYIEAIEADDFTVLPSLSYAKGFVKNYSEFLDVPSSMVLAFFRRQTTEVPRASLLPKGVAEPLNKPFLRLTPGRFVAFLLGGLAGTFLLYFTLQYSKLRQAPPLVILSPKSTLVTQERKIEVLGTTDADATVTINGVSVVVRSDGKFFDQVSLEPGVNKITVTATSRFGKSTAIVREVGVQQQ